MIRERALGKGSGEDLHEKLTVVNSGREELVVELSMTFDADFADLFEVKNKQLIKKGTTSRRVRGQEVELSYQREDFERRTIVHANGARLSQGSADFLLRLKPAESWSGTLRVSFESVAPRERTGATPDLPSSKIKRPHGVNHRDQMDAWLDAAPVVRASWEPAAHVRPEPSRSRSIALARPGSRRRGHSGSRAAVVHGCIRARQLDHELPGTAVRSAACLGHAAGAGPPAGDSVGRLRDAEPGKILHELRFGELTYFGDWPQSPYYGSADSTPLFLILLDEYERWSGDTDLVVELPQARAALDWLENHGDLDGDGYLEYKCRNLASGLENHGWKDSVDSIVYPDGELVSSPRATCELQGYAYDARIRTARLAREIWHDDATADRLERDAADLKARFNSDFWVANGAFFARPGRRQATGADPGLEHGPAAVERDRGRLQGRCRRRPHHG